MPVQTPVPIRLPGSFPPNVPQHSGYNSSPLPPPADYYVSRKELLEIAPYLGVMKSVPSAANDTVVLFDDKGQVKSSGVKLSDKADTETVETLVGEDGGKSARAIAKEEVKQLLGEDPNELYDTFTEVSEFIDEAKQNYQAINNALSETAKSLSTKADKTALDTEISRATQSEAQIDGKINTIIADDAGKSARTIAAEEVAKVVADAPADFDTLKEIAEYIESDKTGAAQMVTKIDDNAKAISAEAQRAQEAEAALRGAVDGKADKVANATSGNLASLDENGNLVDSGNMVAGSFIAASFIGGGSGQVGFELDSTDKWVELYINLHGGVILKFPLHGDTLAVQEDIAPTFDETDVYDEGELVFHNGLYRCVNPNGHTGAWVAADFAVATVEDVLTALRTALAGKVDAEAGKGLSSNDYTNEDKAKLGTAYTPANPPPPPDLSGYATKDAALPRYYFANLEVVDGAVTVPPYTNAGMLSDGTAFTVAVGGEGYYMRDCILFVMCGDVAPTITWPANFHPRTDAETDFACVAGVNNVYWISEYVQGEFVVAGWQATAGGSAV